MSIRLAACNHVQKTWKIKGRFVVNRSFFLPSDMVYFKSYAVKKLKKLSVYRILFKIYHIVKE